MCEKRPLTSTMEIQFNALSCCFQSRSLSYPFVPFQLLLNLVFSGSALIPIYLQWAGLCWFQRKQQNAEQLSQLLLQALVLSCVESVGSDADSRGDALTFANKFVCQEVYVYQRSTCPFIWYLGRAVLRLWTMESLSKALVDKEVSLSNLLSRNKRHQEIQVLAVFQYFISCLFHINCKTYIVKLSYSTAMFIGCVFNW